MFKSLFSDFLHLFYPHNCVGCGSDTLHKDSFLCTKCLLQLSETGFVTAAGNPVEQKFYGRMKVEQAAAAYYFNKDGLLQQLIAQLKYKGNKEMGWYLGKLLGYQLRETDRFNTVDAFIALPLNKKRERDRGYNQAQLICEGIASVWPKPIINGAVERAVFTTTQTSKNISTRWENVKDAFVIADASLIKGKHIVLVDDVITTGSSIEACGQEILKVSGCLLSVLSVGFTK